MTGAIKILLIEDNAADARRAADLLGHDSGFELTHVERLSEATAKLGNGGFDAVLLDLMLPDSSGLATVSSVHDRAPDLPIIVYSGFGAEDVLFAREAVRGGAQDFLPKSMTTPAVMRRAIVTSIERKRLERYRVLPHLAHFDPLTDLPNRAQLRDDVDHMASQARQTGQSAALLCIDLDRFREFNDTLGPAVGDLLLKACALRLRGCLAEHDGLARTSGDEFAVVQGFQAQPEAAIQLGRNILAAFAQPFELDGQELIASASIGIAAIEGDRSSDQVLECAGIALHRAKEEGRATFCLFEPGMEVELRRRRALEWDLKQGLEDNAFQLKYQPQIDARTREITGLTALARWLHPQRGLLEAKDFIADADETGMIVPLGAWVLRAACADAARWPDVRVGVKLSPLQFRHRDLIDLVQHVLDETGLEPGRLALEVPEHALLTDPNAALTLEQLRTLGVRLVLGNFAEGLAHLAHRNGFVFDQVKIGRLFTSSLTHRSDGQIAAHAIEAVAHGLGDEVCFEGIESAEQETMVTTAGCTVLQGHHYSRAMAPAEIDALLGTSVILEDEPALEDQPASSASVA